MKILKPNILSDLDPVSDLGPLIDLYRAEEIDIAVKHIKGIALNSVDLSKFCFRECIFENCEFTDCTFAGADFLDVSFISCDLSNSDFGDAAFNRCQINSSKGVGASFLGCSMQHFVIQGSNFRYANFGMAKLKNARRHRKRSEQREYCRKQIGKSGFGSCGSDRRMLL